MKLKDTNPNGKSRTARDRSFLKNKDHRDTKKGYSKETNHEKTGGLGGLSRIGKAFHQGVRRLTTLANEKKLLVKKALFDKTISIQRKSKSKRKRRATREKYMQLFAIIVAFLHRNCSSGVDKRRT